MERTRHEGRTASLTHALRGSRRRAPSLQVGDGALGGEPAAEDEVVEGDVLRAPRVAGGSLLRQEAGRSEHAEAAVRELLLLHEAELGRVLRREAERVEAEVARHVARAEALEGGVLAGEGGLRRTELLVH